MFGYNINRPISLLSHWWLLNGCQMYIICWSCKLEIFPHKERILSAVCNGRNVLTFQMILPPPSSVSVLQFSVSLPYVYLAVQYNRTVHNHRQFQLLNADIIYENTVHDVCTVFCTVLILHIYHILYVYNLFYILSFSKMYPWTVYMYVCTCSNSSTIAADSSNGVTNTRCCRYSCMRSW
jgi:hypothetical protein